MPLEAALQTEGEGSVAIQLSVDENELMKPTGQKEDMDGLQADVYCPACGYNVRGVTNERCPECGKQIDRSEWTNSRIPWEHRAEIGWLRALWRTIVAVSLWPNWMAFRGTAYPSRTAAARFWVAVLVLACSLPCVLSYEGRDWMRGFYPRGYGIPGLLDSERSFPKADLLVPWDVAMESPVMPALCALLWMALATWGLGWVTVLSTRSPDDRARAATFVRYAIAPLSFSSLFGWPAWCAHRWVKGHGADRYVIATLIGEAALLALSCIGAARLARGAIGASRWTLLPGTMAAALIWVIAGGFAVLVFPWLAGMAWICLLGLLV